MKNTKFFLIIMVSAYLCVSLTGIAPTFAADLERPRNNTPDAAQKTVANGANDFAFRLSAALLHETGDANFVCSPYSVWMPLASLVNAVGEPYKSELMAVLDATGVGETDLNQAASRMIYEIANQGETGYSGEGAYSPLKIANAIFVSRDWAIRQNFVQVFMDAYRGTSMSVDFGAREAVEAVNAWASEHTEGMIDDIVQAFSPQTVAAIANAIYFADRWDWEFSPDKTEKGAFHGPKEDTDAFFMLREGEELLYYEDDNLQAMPLAFEAGGGLLILLPKDGDAVGLLASMTAEYFSKVSQGADYRPGKLLLPRLFIESGAMELNDALSALGLSFLFDPQTAPLTGTLTEGNAPVWISRVTQKAVIEVDEKGATAAAVTVTDSDGAMPLEPTEPFEMICDRPFAFVLYSRTTGGGNQVLFTGVVKQP